MPSVTKPAALTDAFDATHDVNATVIPDVRPEYFEAIGYTLLMLAAMVANIVAISTILRNKHLRRNNHNLLILNLNIMDLGITLLSMTFSVGSFFDDGDYLKESYPLCRFNGFFAMTFTVGNFTTTLCIAVDRYLTVVWSTRFPPNRRRVLILLAYSWIVAILFSSMPTFEVLSKFVYTRATHHCSPAWGSCGYYVAWFVHIYGITVPIMILCYAFVFRAIRHKENRLKSYAMKNTSTGKSSSAVSLGKDFEEKRNSELPSESVTEGEEVKPFRTVHSENYLQVPGARNAAANMKNTPLDSAPSDSKTARYSFRKDLGVRFTLGASLSAPTLDSDTGLSDTNASSTDDDMIKKKKKKERRLKIKMQNLSVDKQVALTGVMLVLTTVICWTPYNIIHACFLNINLNHPIESLTMWIGYLNALLDPLIYTFMNRKTRAARNEHTRNLKNALIERGRQCGDALSRALSRIS